MAFQKDRVIGNGSTSNYWRIIKFLVLDFVNNYCGFELGLYVDVAKRNAENNYKSYQIALTGGDFPFGDILEANFTALSIAMSGHHSFGDYLEELGTSNLTANDYDIDITIDGGTLRKLTITITGNEKNNDIADLLQTALQTAEASNDTVTIKEKRFRVTSEATGTSSTVLIAPGTIGSAGGDLLAALSATVNSQVTGGTKISLPDFLRTTIYNKLKTMNVLALDDGNVDFTTETIDV